MLGRLPASGQVHHHRRHRRREVVLAPAVHGQALPTSARPHHRRRVRRAHDHDRQQADQAPDLGHGARQPRSPAAPQRRAGAARIERALPPCPHRRGRSRSARSHDRTTEGLRALCWCTTSHGPPSTARSLPPPHVPSRAPRRAPASSARARDEEAHGSRLTGLVSRGHYHGATITGLVSRGYYHGATITGLLSRGVLRAAWQAGDLQPPHLLAGRREAGAPYPSWVRAGGRVRRRQAPWYG